MTLQYHSFGIGGIVVVIARARWWLSSTNMEAAPQPPVFFSESEAHLASQDSMDSDTATRLSFPFPYGL